MPPVGGKAGSGAGAATGIDPETMGRAVNDTAKAAKSLKDAAKGQKNAKDVAKDVRKAAESAARAYAAAQTAGASEKAIKAGEKGKKYAVPVLLGLLAVFALVVVAVIVGAVGGSSNDNGLDVPTAPEVLLAGKLDAVPDGYDKAYKEMANKYRLPWTLLAGISKVTTEQGRVAQTDVAEYGSLVDRDPSRGPLSVGTVSFGSKNAPPPGSQIVAVGDSLLEGVQAKLKEVLKDYPFAAEAKVGASIANRTPLILGAFEQKTPVVVIIAGTNDIVGSINEDSLRTKFKTIFDAGAGATCVVWTSLQTKYEKTYATMGERAVRFNSLLASVAANYRNVTIADFASVATGAGMHGGDGLHLNAAGNSALSSAIAKAISGCAPGESGAVVEVPTTTSDPSSTTTVASGNTTTTVPATAPATAPTTTVASAGVATDPSYGAYRCDKDRCGPFPLMGSSDGPQGPYALEPGFVKADRLHRDPNDVREASSMLAEELARLRDAAVKNDPELFHGWDSNPGVAAQLWQFVLSNAPVVWPGGAAINGSCSANGDATLLWPVMQPVVISEYAKETGSTYFDTVISGFGNVKAPGQGVVTEVGQDDTGGYVVINHLGRSTIRLSHLANVLVAKDQSVQVGTDLGSALQGGVHMRVLVNNATVDPRTAIIRSDAVKRGSSGNPQAGTPVTTSTVAPLDATDVQAGIDPTACVAANSGGVPAGVVVPANIVIPVAGVTTDQLYDTWNAPRSGGRHHQGIDIIVEKGRPVIAATPGIVRDDFHSGQPCPTTGDTGNSVGITGDDGNHYYYGHLDTILVKGGQHVEAGQQIGTVGETGNACVSTAHLHFSINEGRANVMNPYPILKGGSTIEAGQYGSSGGGSNAPQAVVAYAVYYGGLVRSDRDAGKLPDWARTATITGAGSATVQGTFTPGTLSPKGLEIAATNPAMAALIQRNFPPEQQDNAVRIAYCESSLTADTVGTNRDSSGNALSHDMGLFQFNDAGTLQTYLTKTGEDPTNLQKAFDPEWNARAAYLLWQDRGWQPWSCARMPTESRPRLTGILDGKVPGPGDTSGAYKGVPTLAGY